MSPRIPTRVVPSPEPADLSPRQVSHEFRRRLGKGLALRPAGDARRDPERLLLRPYAPRSKVELFDTVFYLSSVRQNEDLRFFVAYVVQDAAYPRLFYKDVSLIWRSASHFIRSESENWIGKGDLKTLHEGGEEITYADESTTDLPLELQTALEALVRNPGAIPTDVVAVERVLRRGPDDRLAPYRDFSEPRRRAQANPRNLINGGKRVAYFGRKNDPASLRFVSGFEPDFEKGVLELSTGTSKMYGGELRRYRILSRNQKIQYLFMASPRMVWIIPPQATTTELTSYGLRTIDVLVDEDLCVPGFEYHFEDATVDPPELVTQIPAGYAGAESEVDPSRADASAWLERLPVIAEFRRILG